MSETSLFHDGASISSGGSINLFLFSHKSCPTFGNPVDCNTPGFPCPSSFPGVCPSSCQLIQWCHPTFSFSVVPFSSLPLIFPSIGVFSNELALLISDQSTGPSASAPVLPMIIPGWLPLGLTGLISFWLKLSSSAPQFKTINSLALSLLYDPTLTSIHDCCKNHCFEYMDLN